MPLYVELTEIQKTRYIRAGMIHRKSWPTLTIAEIREEAILLTELCTELGLKWRDQDGINGIDKMRNILWEHVENPN